MLKVSPPLSNYQRQQAFLARHPGYYARYRARRRVEDAALLAAKAAAKAPALQLELFAPAQIPAKRAPLMLPAPVEVLVVPGMNVIEAISARQRDAIPISQPETTAANKSIAA